MRKSSLFRFLNGLAVAIVMLIIAVHMVAGALSLSLPIPTSLSWLIWVAIGLIAAHVVLSIVTSYQQLTDKERPPSENKKRHLALKWGTGILLLAAIIAHVEGMLSPIAVMAVLAAVTALHVCVGAKSFLTDLNLDKRHRDAVRVAAILVAAISVSILVMGVL